MQDDFPVYSVQRAAVAPCGNGQWDSPAWLAAETLEVSRFYPLGSAHRPLTEAKMLYDAEYVYGLFRVQDQYVVCRHAAYQSPVCRDSCVEFFVRPKPDKGYLNFEMNCGGCLLASYIEDWTRVRDPKQPDREFADNVRLPEEAGGQVRVYASMTGPLEEEIAEEIAWHVEFHIPLKVLEQYVGTLGDPRGQEWRANFYKCADESSHPHWGTWSPLDEELNFHQPDRFGVIRFE